MPEKFPVVSVSGNDYYALQPKQLELFRRTPLAEPTPEKGCYPSRIGYGGAAGGGKSYAARAIATAASLKWPGTTHIIFRRTQPEVRENHIVKFLGELPDMGGRLYKFNKNESLAEFFNGSRLLFGYLRTQEDVFRYQGAEYDSLHFEEATHYSWFQVSWLMNNRLRATTKESRPFTVFYSNPGNQGHAWFKRIFVDKRYDVREHEQPEDHTFVQARIWDNYELIHRDPAYVERLLALPEPWRSWLLEGDWASGAGTALQELDRSKHLVEPFEVPSHWIIFGALDWGFSHRWVFGVYAVNEDERIFKLDTIYGWRHQPNEIAERIWSRAPVRRMKYMVAGQDLWAKREAFAPSAPSLAEQFMSFGLFFRRASMDRKAGLQALRQALQWRALTGPPRLVFFDTEGNRRCFNQLETIVPDPDDMEDTLKIDVDDTGEGGDDFYDEVRYAMSSRPWAAKGRFLEGQRLDAWAPEVLAYEEMEKHRSGYSRLRRGLARRYGKDVVVHPEFGGIY